MRDLMRHEQFELEVLSRLHSGRFLADLIFGGGTMLRLCHGLDRYSVDLDFWGAKDLDWASYFSRMKTYLEAFYKLSDSANKHFTLLLELKAAGYPRALKIEIRKEKRSVKTETSIAYRPHAQVQVLVKTVKLEDMMQSKIAAFLDRKEIRDAYDIEFMFKRGVGLDAEKEILDKLRAGLGRLGKKDFSVKLGSLLNASERKYYQENGFRILEAALRNLLKNK